MTESVEKVSSSLTRVARGTRWIWIGSIGSILAVGVSGFGAWRKYVESQPVPIAYGRCEVNTDQAQEYADPKVEIRFGNKGGFMILRKLRLVHPETKAEILPESLADDNCVMSSKSQFLGKEGIARPWDREGIIPIVTYRPAKQFFQTNHKNADWCKEHLKKKKALEVEYEWYFCPRSILGDRCKRCYLHTFASSTSE